MASNLYLNERKYYNEVTIPYSAWNEPLSALWLTNKIRQWRHWRIILFLFHQFCYENVHVCSKLSTKRIGLIRQSFVECTWSFLTSYLVESYLERCLKLQTLTETLIKMLKSDILEMGNIKQQKSRSTKNC